MEVECEALAPEAKSAGTSYPLKPANLVCGVNAIEQRRPRTFDTQELSKFRATLARVVPHAGGKGNAFRT